MGRDLILDEQTIWAIAQYTITTGDTIRETAKRFYISKSTVHRALKLFRETEQDYLVDAIDGIIAQHLRNRSRNGGMATKRYWEAIKASQKRELDQIGIDDYDVLVPQR